MLGLGGTPFFWGRWAKGPQEKEVWLRGISGTLGQDGHGEDGKGWQGRGSVMFSFDGGSEQETAT